MADERFQFEADDELLSAYLDDELTAVERARVEGRLAADPAARELLAQLRGVSEAVRRLPAEGVGEDLRDSILERAERAVLTGAPVGAAKTQADAKTHADGESEGVGSLLRLVTPPSPSEQPVAKDSRPRARVTIGRTPRGWIWAGLAVAAALLLMVFGPEAERDGELPALAQREAARDIERRGELEMRAVEPVPAPPAEGPPADRIATAEERAVDERVAADELAAVAHEDDVLVVHVNVTPAAYRNRSFDRLLVSSGVVIEPPAAGLAVRPEAARGAASRAETPTRARAAEGVEAEEPAVDMVLVEARPAQIEIFLCTLNSDVSNFAAVEIDDAATRDAAPAKQQAIERNWMQYNRGSVPLQQKQQVPRQVEMYYYQARDGVAVVEGEASAAALSKGEFRGGYGDGYEPQARARRVQSLERADGAGRYGVELRRERDVASRDAAGVAGRRLEEVGRQPSAPAAVEEETLQVLFVLSPEPGEASSPKAADAPE